MPLNQPLHQHLAYASFVLRKEKVLYVETPKVASSSVKRLLCHLYPSEANTNVERQHQPPLGMDVHSRRLHACPSLVDLPDAEQDEVLTSEHWLRLCLVRNPYERLFSCWRDKVYLQAPGFLRTQRPLLDHLAPIEDPVQHFRAFARWVLDRRSVNPHWHPMHELLCVDSIRYSLVARLETLAEDLLPFLQRLGLDYEEFRRFSFNSSMPLRLAQVYDQALADAVYQFYEPDFQLFGYAPSSWTHVGVRSSGAAASAASAASLTDMERFAVAKIRERNRVIAHLQARLSGAG